MGKGVAGRTRRSAGRRPDAELKLYPGLRHEILNEADRETVYRDILDWLESRLPPVRG